MKRGVPGKAVYDLVNNEEGDLCSGSLVRQEQASVLWVRFSKFFQDEAWLGSFV